MKTLLKMMALVAGIMMMEPAVRADVNINLLNLNSPASQKLQQTYSNAYGFSPAQVAPVMIAPATEVPTILQIAKNAGQMPLAIWGLRKMGMSYMDILKVYTLSPSILYSPDVSYDRFGPALVKTAGDFRQYGNQWPQNVVVEDPALIQLGQIKLFTNYLKVPSISLVGLPTDPLSFTQVVLNPWGYSNFILPPGQARQIIYTEEPIKIKHKKFKHKKWKGKKWKSRD